MSEHQAEYGIRVMCRVLEVSASGYYAWEQREPSSREVAGHNRVARLMRDAGLVGASRRKGCWTTRRNKDARPAPDLVERKFVAAAPDRLWVADIERHEALLNRVVMKGHHRRLVAASRPKLRAA